MKAQTTHGGKDADAGVRTAHMGQGDPVIEGVLRTLRA